jgi:heme-degrading monooxygenase HmoA
MESRIKLHRGMQLLIDTERLHHVVWHPGPAPRYALITSWESGDALRQWVESRMPEPVG